MTTERAATGRRSTRRRRILWTVLLVLAGLIALGVVMSFQALSAYTHLRDAGSLAPNLRDRVLAGDEKAVARRVKEIRRHTDEAHGALSGPHWAAAAALPVVGPDVAAARTTTAALDDLADGALLPLTEVAAIDPAGLTPRRGRIPLEPLERMGPPLATAAAAAEQTDERLRGVDAEQLSSPLRTRFDEVAAQVEALATATSTGAEAVRVLPGILGADGARRYLVLVQNNSEPRVLGGIPGSIIEIGADDGRVDLISQRSASSFGESPDPVLRLTRAERDLYGDQLGTFVTNATDTPDFSRSAQLARAHWQRLGGDSVDGVIALDPVALDLLLRATGPVTLPNGERLASGGAAPVLLNRIYLREPDGEAQDQFFASAAAAIFDHVTTGGRLDMAEALDGAIEATSQGRLYFRADNRQERDVVAGTALSGPLAADPRSTIGVFVHDRTQSKMGYYQRMRVTATPVSCEPDAGIVDVAVTLRSTAPRRRGALPVLVTGRGGVVPQGDIATQVFLYAPRGARLTSFVPTSGPKRALLRRHLGHAVASVPVDLAPGEKVTLTFRIEQVVGSAGDLDVRTTPGPAEGQFAAQARPCGQG